jgi:cytochrome c553
MILYFRWDRRNLVTLCISCHDKVHARTGGKVMIDNWMLENREEDYQYLRDHKPEQVKEYQFKEIYKELKEKL